MNHVRTTTTYQLIIYMGITVADIENFIAAQLDGWETARRNHDGLKQVETRLVGDTTVMFNPARAASATAKTDARSLAERPCFLCTENRPGEQRLLPWRNYGILVNPFPIFPGHLTIVEQRHTPQSIEGRIPDMTALAGMLGDQYTVFFNGAKCGASAPDHMHFQAARFKANPDPSRCRIFDISDPAAAEKCAAYLSENGDPKGEMVNMLCYEGKLAVIRRKRHRPLCYGCGEGQMLLSPASVEMAGYLVTIRREDFDALTPESVARIMDEVMVS